MLQASDRVQYQGGSVEFGVQCVVANRQRCACRVQHNAIGDGIGVQRFVKIQYDRVARALHLITITREGIVRSWHPAH